MNSKQEDYIEDYNENNTYYFPEGDQNPTYLKEYHKTAIIWSILILILNIWTLFSSIFWFSVLSHPLSVLLFIEITIECIIFFEILCRLYLRIWFSEPYESLNLLHTNKKDGVWVFVILLISSFPIITLNVAINGAETSENKSEEILSYLYILKILRSFEISRALSKIEEKLFYKKFKTLIFIKFLINLMYVLVIMHISTCSWLFVSGTDQKIVRIYGNNPYNPFKQSRVFFVLFY